MLGRTQRSNSHTTKATTRHSALNVTNKDPNFDYCFRRREDIEQGGGVDMYGYEAVGANNSNGEEWGGPAGLSPKTKGAKQKVYHDTILCKRPKETSKFFKSMEDDKYNAQVRFIRDAAKNARLALRDLDPGSVVKDETKASSGVFTQRTGPTETAMPDTFNSKKLEGK